MRDLYRTEPTCDCWQIIQRKTKIYNKTYSIKVAEKIYSTPIQYIDEHKAILKIAKIVRLAIIGR